jgi:hypothetical protein
VSQAESIGASLPVGARQLTPSDKRQPRHRVLNLELQSLGRAPCEHVLGSASDRLIVGNAATGAPGVATRGGGLFLADPATLTRSASDDCVGC